MKIERKWEKLADGSSIAIPCVFSADTAGPGIDVVIVVDSGGGEVVLGVVGIEAISSSCNNKDDIVLLNFRSIKKIKYVKYTNRNVNYI